MANRLQTKITNFSFPSTIEKLKKDPALYDGTVLLHDYSHPDGVVEGAGFDVHRLDASQSQYVTFANSVAVTASQDFEISCKFFLNSLAGDVALFGWDYNSGTHITIQPTSGNYGRLQFRLGGPNAFFPFTDESIRVGELYNLNIKRESNVWTFKLNEQVFDADTTDPTILDNAFTLDYIGARSEEPGSGGGGTDILQNFLDGYVWDVKVKIGTQVGTSDNTVDLPGTGDNPWVNLGTEGNTYDGSTFDGPDSSNPTAVTLTREVIGKDILVYDDTMVNLAATEAAALGVNDTSVSTQAAYDDMGVTAGRGYRLSEAIETNSGGTSINSHIYFAEDISDGLVTASAAGRNYGLSFWFKPELDVFDITNIGYFFRWGTSTSTTPGSYNYWILLSGASGTRDIKIQGASSVTTLDYANYENTNQGIVNIIFTENGAWVNGTQVKVWSSPITLLDFNAGSQFSSKFQVGTAQHTSDRHIAYLYRLNFADIDTSGVTEAQWIAKEYETGVKYIKAIVDSTT